MKKIKWSTFMLSLALFACNSSNEGNVETKSTMGDTASRGPSDTNITIDSRRNAPGVYDAKTDTGNKTERGGPKDAPYPTQH